MRITKLLVALTTIIITIIATATLAYGASTAEFDIQNINKGTFGVKISDTSGKAFKVIVEKDLTRLDYNIDPNGTEQIYPLQLGNGSYKISVLINKSGTQYSTVSSKTIEVKLDNQNTVYLNSIKLINFNKDTEVVKKAKELTKDLTTNQEKINAIYKYVINLYSYDYNKKNLASTYVPNLSEIYKNKKGICYDYAATIAAMLRSIDIPTKLVMGSSAYVSVYHAWNEVYDENTKKWNVLDATKGSVYSKAGKTVTTFEKADKYTSKYYY